MASLTIVLVDDDPLMHRMLVPRLRELRTPDPIREVISAQTPQAALDAVKAAAAGPLAIVSDFNLKSTMTGLDLLGRIREARPDALRILFSGYSDVQLGDVTRQGDAQAFFEKPLHLDELLKPLERTLADMMSNSAA